MSAVDIMLRSCQGGSLGNQRQDIEASSLNLNLPYVLKFIIQHATTISEYRERECHSYPEECEAFSKPI
jgi:hypothetical protein